MDEIKDIIPLFQYLLTGFMAAWIFYGLSSYAKPSSFERIVQAFVFTAFVQLLSKIIELILFNIGYYFPKIAFVWDSNSSILLSSISAVFVGLSFTYLANNDIFHEFLRKYKLTRTSSHASEWYSAFIEPAFVVLHLKNGRRLYGWPLRWPYQSDKGHFLITNASWLKDDGTSIDLPMVKSILVSASDVEMIEFS